MQLGVSVQRVVEIQGWSEVPRDAGLFETLLICEERPGMGALEWAGGVKVGDWECYDQTNYALSLRVQEGEALRLQIGYDTGRFEAGSMRRLLGHF